MHTPNETPTPAQVVAELRAALSNSTENLEDCTDMDVATMAELQADNAALAHLVGNDATGRPRVLAYL